MPAQKEVLLLGSLCVDSVSKLVVDIVSHSCENAKTKEISKEEGKEINTKDGGENDKQDRKENLEKEEKESDKLEEKESSKEENNTDVDEEKEESKQDQEIIDNQNCQENGDISGDNKEEKVLKNDTKLPQTNKEDDNIESKLERLEAYRKALVQLLTSHSHVALHEKLFDSIVLRCGDVYMTKKKMRPIFQDIVPFFLNTSLRSLDFGKSRMFAEAQMCQMLVGHLENAARLGVLDIGRSCYWRVDVFENLSTKLKNLPELTVLRINYICTPSMISGLADNCPNLIELNLKGSERITDAECGEIAKCVSLQSLDITGTRITGKGCWKIIDSIKTLSWLWHCAFNCNSDALLFESRAQLFDCIKEQVNRRNEPVNVGNHANFATIFNLKNFWLFNPCTEDMLSILLCPQLEELRLDFIFQDLAEEPEVEVLSQIPEIKRFKVNFYDRCVVDLASQMIEGLGSKLTSLDLHLADDYYFAARVHNVVARSCRNLVNLRFSGDYMARHSLEESDDSLDLEIEAPAHPHLENLSITGVVSDCRLRFMLNHAPAVQNIHLDGELEWLHDDMFESFLSATPLPSLEYVWFNVSTTITLKTVRLLLMNDNLIHTIGRLCHMANATMKEYQEIQELARQNNYNVKLIWVTDERPK